MPFKIHTSFTPKGDQPGAISSLSQGIRDNVAHQTLLGVTGSGKTFTLAKVIEEVQLPTIVISHNKTLAAQLYEEFKEFFPENAVEYFVSFYDYYQPEAYIPTTDTYIEKTSDINEDIDRLRLKATSSLLSRNDVIVVASVSCIYNIGSPDLYRDASFTVSRGQNVDRDTLLEKLVAMQYTRDDASFTRATFRVRGDVIDVFPAYEETALRFEAFGDEIERISRIHPVRGTVLYDQDSVTIFPAKHYVSTRVPLDEAIAQVKKELHAQLEKLNRDGKIVEAQRLQRRTMYDMEMLQEVGYVSGIENYSRILDGREPGSRPSALLDFFSRPFLTIIDESHVTIPQIGGMYNGDRARKQTLVEHGFRLPCALDNRPLQFHEFETMLDKTIYSSATPAEYEIRKSEGVVVEQVIRPTGLVDPPIEVRPALNQVDDLIGVLREVVARQERALVVTLTKKMAEDLSTYLEELQFRTRYLHSEIHTLERSSLLRTFRQGEFDVLVGINLLREGLDLPEVSLVAILDADKEGFLRSSRSLIQIAGRAARNIHGTIILYADERTRSIERTIQESRRRREKQLAYNEEHHITPRTVTAEIKSSLWEYKEAQARDQQEYEFQEGRASAQHEGEAVQETIARLEREMHQAAERLEFEHAARLRDTLARLKGSV
jgi:excinuclease ABC subunit B